MSKGQIYIETQLGAAGVVLCNAALAYRLRRDLWGSRMDVDVSGLDSRKYLATLASQDPITLFTFNGEGLTGFGGCFNTNRLEERIHDMYGIDIKITVVDSLMPPAPVQQGHDPQTHAARTREEKLEKLRSLATQEPPAHDCSLRREILDARAELEQLSETWESAPIA